MAQASTLTDSDIRRVFRIIETTRHAGRNRLASILSIYAGMRIGEIAALKIDDVATTQGEVRHEIKLDAVAVIGESVRDRTCIITSHSSLSGFGLVRFEDRWISQGIWEDKPTTISVQSP